MKIKTTKLFGIKIWETEVMESWGDKSQKEISKPKRVREGGAVLDYTPEQEERDKNRELDIEGIKLTRGTGV